MKTKSIVSGVAVIGVALMLVVAHSTENVAPLRSSFNQVWDVVSSNPDSNLSQHMIEDMQSYGTPGAPQLPHYSSLEAIAGSIADFAMLNAARRTVNNHEDYHDYFQKLVHANGACFRGTWEITEDSAYTGEFSKGSKALMIGRLSTATPLTTNDQNRSFGFAGKIFPTQNPDEAVPTANFFTGDNLNGSDAKHILDVTFVNEPLVNMDGKAGIPLKILNWIFSAADSHPLIRPLWPISHAGLSVGSTPITPHWMRLRAAKGVQSAQAQNADFRDEVSAKNYPNGLVFTIEVSDKTKDPNSDEGWVALGQIRTSALTTSFGCDRRLHFPHARFVEPAL